MKSSVAATTVALALAASSANAFDIRPMQWGRSGMIENKPLKQGRLTYDMPNQPIEYKMPDALILCSEFCDDTPEYWQVGNVQIDDTNYFNCRCYDSRDAPKGGFVYNSDSSWSSFDCNPHVPNFPCYKK